MLYKTYFKHYVRRPPFGGVKYISLFQKTISEHDGLLKLHIICEFWFYNTTALFSRIKTSKIISKEKRLIVTYNTEFNVRDFDSQNEFRPNLSFRLL